MGEVGNGRTAHASGDMGAFQDKDGNPFYAREACDMKLTRALAIIAITLTIAVLGLWSLLPATEQTDSDGLTVEMKDHQERCHKQGMGAGKLMEYGKVAAIKCYER